MMIFNGLKTKTTLHTGDQIILRRRQKTISFFRDGKPLLFSNSDDRMLFAGEEVGFKSLVILLAETHYFKSSLATEINDADFSYLKIDDEDCISYRF